MAALTPSTTEFAGVLPSGGALAGLDVGTKTIGLALCDAGHDAAAADDGGRDLRFGVRAALQRPVQAASMHCAVVPNQACRPRMAGR